MSKDNGNPFLISVRGDCDLVYYNFPISTYEFDQIQDDCNCEILPIVRRCMALCREKALNIVTCVPLIDIPSCKGFTAVRVDYESEL